MRSRTAVDSRALRDVHDAFQSQCSRNTNAFRRLDPTQAMRSQMLHTSVPHSHVLALEAALRGRAGGRSTDRDKAEAPRSEPVTFFHSRRVPQLSLYDLGSTLNTAVECGEEAMLITLVLMDRFCANASVSPTEHIMHRLYVTCLQLAMKAHSDHYLKNNDFASAAGVSLAELNCCEAIALDGLKWRVQVSSEQCVCFVRDALASHNDTLATALPSPTPAQWLRLRSAPTGTSSTLATLGAKHQAHFAVNRAQPPHVVAPTTPMSHRHVDPSALRYESAAQGPNVVPLKPPPTPDISEDMSSSPATSFCVVEDIGTHADPETPPNTPVWGPENVSSASAFRGLAHLRALFRPLPLTPQ